MSRHELHEPVNPPAVGAQRARSVGDSHSYSSAHSPFAHAERRQHGQQSSADRPSVRQNAHAAERSVPAPAGAQAAFAHSGPHGDAIDGERPAPAGNANKNTSSINTGRVRGLPHISSFNHNLHQPAAVHSPGGVYTGAFVSAISGAYIPFPPPSDDDVLLQSQYSSATHIAQSPTLPSYSYGQQAHAQCFSTSPKPHQSHSTLWWGELEAWMDEEYAKQVCNLMGWDSVTVKIPHTVPDPVTGTQANNPGYCFLTFPTPQQASTVLAQVNNTNASGTGPVIMPNSTKPFTLNWASSPAPSPSTTALSAAPAMVNAIGASLVQREYSIFVGDLAPETSNSDLVAVFRNPVLGLRNDRAPKFIRPFYSCKSAKIMLDPATGVSRGYGFVRFTEEADQQRALIEMHGLYCLSRPMRISPATAKFKSPPAAGIDGLGSDTNGYDFNYSQERASQMTIPTSGSGSSLGSSSSIPSLTTSTAASSSSVSSTYTQSDTSQMPQFDAFAQLFGQANGASDGKGDSHGRSLPSITAPLVPTEQQQRFIFGTDESWKHQAQARAILGNLMGPNGEQLTSTDPYNTTVFVGGLSPLISEETLRTFFAPFGDIHYVKVPVGKHCGFVQFVRKADAERAIERMQGFPIGGSRIRLSWGRSQYKAAQAAAQAAAAAQIQGQLPLPAAPVQLTPEQALELLQQFGIAGFSNGNNYAVGKTESGPVAISSDGLTHDPRRGPVGHSGLNHVNERLRLGGNPHNNYPLDQVYSNRVLSTGSTESERPTRAQVSSFSPFSPDPSFFANMTADRDSTNSVLVGDGLLRTSSHFPIRNSSAVRITAPLQHEPNDETFSGTGDTYGFPLSKAVPLFQLNRAPGRTTIRPSSRTSPKAQEQEHDPIHDLNGTLASLDLDNASPRSTRSPADISDASSVQFTVMKSNRASPAM